MNYTYIVSSVFLLIFTIIASIDGIYFHLYKYKLYLYKETLREHNLHTLNSFLFPFTIFFLFVLNSSGLLLWFSVFLTLFTLIIEFIDVFEERKSRQKLGGLTSLEYSMHFGMSGLRATYTSILLSQKPLESWIINPNLIIGAYPNYLKVLGGIVTLLGVFIFFVHYYLGKFNGNQNLV